MVNDIETPTQANHIRALELFLDSATFENGYKTYSSVKIADILISEGHQASSSAVGRWRKLYHFDKRLELKINTVMLQDKSVDIKSKAINKATSDTIDRFKVNGELIDDLYAISQAFVDRTKENMANNRFNREDIKLAKDLLVLTTGREDKMLDRLAGSGDEKLSSSEMKEQFELIDVEIEE